MSLGFWTNLYHERIYNNLRWNLARVFSLDGISNPTTVRRRVYSHLSKVLSIRNRICHLEPIIFNQYNQIEHSKITDALDSLLFLAKALVGEVDYLNQLDTKIREKLP